MRLVIRRIHLAHCKRGPDRCLACREMNIPRICLLDVDPPDAGRLQRRVLAFQENGEAVWREYDVVRTFGNEAEARAHAAAHGIEDVELGGSA